MLAALAFFSTTPLASCLGSLPLFQEGNFLLADTPSLGLLGQALKPGARRLSPLRLHRDCYCEQPRSVDNRSVHFFCRSSTRSESSRNMSAFTAAAYGRT